MRGVDFFRDAVRVLLGDESGRRYSDGLVDMGLREALGVYGRFCPNRELRRVRVSAVNRDRVVLSGVIEEGCRVLMVRDERGEPVSCGFRWDGVVPVLDVSGDAPGVGDVLGVELGLPHGIKGLDGWKVTTVPDGHGLVLSGGAAGYAMRMRARSITEVFGKRPEDRAALMEQAERLIGEFLGELSNLALMESFQKDPWPHNGWMS